MLTTDFYYSIFFIFLFYYFGLTSYNLILAIVGFFEKREKIFEERGEGYQTLSSSSFTAPLSIIVPAHNEEEWIANAVDSILNLQYPEFEVIVVNDESSDKTLDILKNKFKLKSVDKTFVDYFHTGKITEIFKSETHSNISVISKIGKFKKAGAANTGISFAKYQYVCVVDADTVLEPDALLKVMMQIEKNPEKIIGAGSYFGLNNGFKIGNGKIIERNLCPNALIAYQNLEYIRSFIGTRIAWSKWNAMPIVSGGFGIWRRDIFIKLGGYDPELSSEDLEFTFRAHDFIVKNKEKDYQIIMLPYNVGWTQGPSNTSTLIQQRSRWQRVSNETIAIYRHIFLNPKYGAFAFLIFPYFLFYEVMGIMFEAASLLLILWGFVSKRLNVEILAAIIIMMIFFQASISIISIFAFARDQRLLKTKDVIYLIILSFLEFFWYSWIITYAKIAGTTGYLKKIRTFDQYIKI